MKASKFLALLIALVLMFSIISCKDHGDSGDYEDPHDQYLNNIQNGGSSNADGSNADGNESSGDQQSGEGNVTYIYSVVSKTLHLPGCYHTERMNADYKFEYTGSITPLLEKGYTICRDCLVPDVEEEEDPEEDEGEKVAKEDATFLINRASKVLHTLDCHNAKIIVEKNVKYTDLTLEELIALDEYRPCSVCLPDEAEEYDKKHPDEKK